VLDSLKKYGGMEMILKILEEFEEEADGLITEISAAMTTNRNSEILSNLHTLKGNAGTLGLDKLAEASRITEEKLKNNDFSNLEKDFIYLQSEFESFKNIYKQIIKNLY